MSTYDDPDQMLWEENQQLRTSMANLEKELEVYRNAYTEIEERCVRLEDESRRLTNWVDRLLDQLEELKEGIRPKTAYQSAGAKS